MTMLIRRVMAAVTWSYCQILSAAEPRDIAFMAVCDQSEQRYVLIEPEGFRERQQRDLLIALHGHGSDRWQFISSDRDEVRATRDFADQHGMLYVSPDYRARTSWMGPLAEADVVQIIADLKRNYSVHRVFLCGGSMGGSSALTFTALHPELVSGVVAMNPTANHLEYTNFQDAIAASFGGSKRDIPNEYKRRSAEYWPERFTMPVAISTGGLDVVVPCHSSQRLASVLSQLARPVLLLHRDQGGHSTNYADAGELLMFMFNNATVLP